MCKKVASRVIILGRVRSFVTKEAATLVHDALMLPLFGYCDIAWSNLLQQDIDRLQCLQNRSSRIITRCSRSSEAIEQLHWPPPSSRRSYHKAKLVFLLSSLISSQLFFIIFYQILEHSQLFHKAKYEAIPTKRLTKFWEKDLSFCWRKNFYNLPLNIVKSENIQTFCRRARHFIFFLS